MSMNRYRTKHIISWQDIDCNGRFALRAFANIMQEAAWQHAEILGFGFDYMAQHNAVWVLLETRLQCFTQPKWRDEINVCTWHKGSRGALCLRDYVLSDASGAPIMKVSSDWVLLNHKTRRLLMPDILLPFHDTIVMEDALPDFAIRFDNEAQDNEVSYTVTFSDLDFNGHVNNGRYYEWVANLFEPLNTDKKAIDKMQIKYQAECFLGDEIAMRYALTDSVFRVQGIRKSDGKKVFFALAGLE